jgi:hypothetical protein
MNGLGSGMATAPARMYKSMGLTATAPTRTNTSPLCGTGCGSSPYWMTWGLPVVSMKAAFTVQIIQKFRGVASR